MMAAQSHVNCILANILQNLASIGLAHQKKHKLITLHDWKQQYFVVFVQVPRQTEGAAS